MSHWLTYSREGTMRKILVTLVGLAVLAAAVPASAATASRPCPLRNRHCVQTCSWVQTATIGSVPHLVCSTSRVK